MVRKPIKVVELFAGVGGFRVGLERACVDSEAKFDTVWSNQWEPGSKNQDAYKVYAARWGSKGNVNEDIASIPASKIPKHDLLVGGFPCQDYSVARTLNQSHGIVGKKGVLWWEIHRILKGKKERPKYLFLENVDRLLKSPASQRGRDFAIMLASLSGLGYALEWRVINAAEYGMPQRRRRVYILGYHKRTALYKDIVKSTKEKDGKHWLLSDGLFAHAFPVDEKGTHQARKVTLAGPLPKISETFNAQDIALTPFENSGMMVNRKAFTMHTSPFYDGPRKLLKDILLDSSDVPDSFYIDEAALPKWKYLKGPKSEDRQNKKNGGTYKYSEGALPFPDTLDREARTIITSEGGSAPSRFKHVIMTDDGRYRRLTPVELERINMFDDEHTMLAGVSDTRRAFFMGNALVVGVITVVGKELLERI